MERAMTASMEVMDLVARMKAAEQAFVLATVVPFTAKITSPAFSPASSAPKPARTIPTLGVAAFWSNTTPI